MNPVTIHLEAHHEYYAPEDDVPQQVYKALGFPPLVHQLATYQALKKSHVVFNSFPTGTGKTLAAYLHLLDRPSNNALVIAPTNALITQHVQDLRDFKQRSGIPHIILEVDAAKLREIGLNENNSRNPDTLFSLLSNPFRYAEKLGLDEALKAQRPPLVLVTNPDLFYYALYGLVNRFDERNLMQTIFQFFDYVIIDEFHYYDAKQFCVFLFFTALSHSMGFFEHGRRMAILTATPNDEISKYFDRLAAKGLSYNHVGPEIDYEVGHAVTSLSPIELILTPFASRQSADFTSQIQTSRLQTWIRQDLTGAVISDRLADISILANRLKGKLEFEKITGAVYKADRPTILKKPLLLATPTVDIGYNFRREHKNRQNIDFLIFIAEYRDEFWQRLGRAGRVLGKKQQDFQSQVHALVPEEVVEYLQNYNGKTLSHKGLKALMEIMPPKPFNATYIASDGLQATLASFSTIRQMLSSDNEHLLLEALEVVQSTFAPSSRRPKTKEDVRAYSSEQIELAQLLTNNTLPKPKTVRSFLAFHNQPQTDKHVDQFLDGLKHHQKVRDLFSGYLRAKRAVYQAEMSFRGSGNEVAAAVYDPQKFLTNNATVTNYNLIHLLRYFELYIYEDQHAFAKEAKEMPPSDSLYVRLERLLEPEQRPTITLKLQTDERSEEFEARYLHKLWAFKNLELLLKVGDAIRPDVSGQIREVLKDIYIPMMIFKDEDEPLMRKYLKDFKIYPRDIQINFIHEGSALSYLAILGADGKQAIAKLVSQKRWFNHVTRYAIVG